MNTGDIYLFYIAFITAGIWLSITSLVCSIYVFPLGIACAPQNVATIVNLFSYFFLAISIALSILT